MKRFYFILMIAPLLSDCGKKESENINKTKSTPLFSLLSPKETGVDFVNEVVDTEKFNILTYRNFYNGGGVAIGDINNDSLPDLYFTSNQHQNKLYLNKGNFIFEDITKKAGTGGTKMWSTGVTMADVNNDGLLDIYVCNSGDVDGADRENELFINNGDLTFSEKAKEYNLNNEGYSTHAAFFDYDLDGDLDCYILNNSFKDPAKIELYRKVREESNYPGGDKLMRNDGGIFKDVTKQAGIFSSEIGFGLGVSISDLNNDHLPDIYISNDFWERDYLYINKGKGKFSEELPNRINYCSTSSMGADVADLNNDGSPEIFTTEMLPADNARLKTRIAFDPYHLEDLKYRSNFHYQLTQNCLHLNDGEGRFGEIAFFSGVAATDWSWGALMFDFENDGKKDIFVSNGIAKDIMSLDFREFIADQQSKNQVNKIGAASDLALIKKMPSRALNSYAFHNTGDLIFQDQALTLGLSRPSFSNGSAYGDLDNDGDLDLVINNVNAPSYVYRNEANKILKNRYLKVNLKGSSKNPFGIGALVSVKTKDDIQTIQNFNSRGFESSIEPNLLFGLGKTEIIEELEVTWPDKKRQLLTSVSSNKTITLDYQNAVESNNPSKKTSSAWKEISQQAIGGDARHYENLYNDFNYEILLPHMLSTEGPRLVMGDVNQDKLEDFILLGASGDADKLFVQKTDGSFNLKTNAAFIKDKNFESTCGALFDFDRDGDLDLMVGSGGNEIEKDQIYFTVRMYSNDGSGNFFSNENSVPQLIGNFSTLEATDYDGDGDIDVFLGARAVPGNYGLQPKSFLLSNINGNWVDVAPSALGNIGMVTDASWSDIDSDGDQDLLVVGDWMAITIFKNENGYFENSFSIPNSKGWWNRIEPADLDQDGDIDFVLGNRGLNTKFKATPAKPITMFVNDFDGNGKSEFIINWYPPVGDLPYPFASKQELTSQLPGLRKSILKYEDYAPKTYDSLFKPEVRKTSLSYEVNYLESAVLWNEGNQFVLKALPQESQYSPVFGIVANDLDDDGNTDIWLGGNFYAFKPQVGRQDASRGVFLKGNAKTKSFVSLPPSRVGLYVEGEVRDAVMITTGPPNRILVARNNAKVLLFEKKK